MPVLRFPFWLKLVITIPAALFLSSLSALITVSNIASPVMGAIVMRMPLGGSAEIRAGVASLMIEFIALSEEGGAPVPPERKATTARQAADIARSALEQEPVNVEGARTLGTAMAMLGEEEQAQQMLLYAQSLSRRDHPTQTALAERALAQNRPKDAVAHLGRVLATSVMARDATLKRMVAASSDPAFQTALGRALAQGPNWRGDFFRDYARLSASPAALHRVAALTWADGWTDGEAAVATRVLARLIELRAPEAAFALYAQEAGEARTRLTLRNGGFDEPESGGPFEWSYTNSARITALPIPHPSGKGRVLSLQSSSGTTSVAARQIVRLGPAAYRVSMRAGDVGRDRFARPEFWITCLGSENPLFSHVAPPAPAEGLASSGQFTIPASGCPLQAAEVRFGAPATAARNQAWIDDIVIEAGR